MSYRTQIVSNVDAACWLDTREYSLHPVWKSLQVTLTRASALVRTNLASRPDSLRHSHHSRSMPRLSVKHKRTSDISKLAEIFVVLVISSFALADGLDAFDEFD